MRNIEGNYEWKDIPTTLADGLKKQEHTSENEPIEVTIHTDTYALVSSSWKAAALHIMKLSTPRYNEGNLLKARFDSEKITISPLDDKVLSKAKLSYVKYIFSAKTHTIKMSGKWSLQTLQFIASAPKLPNIALSLLVDTSTSIPFLDALYKENRLVEVYYNTNSGGIGHTLEESDTNTTDTIEIKQQYYNNQLRLLNHPATWHFTLDYDGNEERLIIQSIFQALATSTLPSLKLYMHGIPTSTRFYSIFLNKNLCFLSIDLDLSIGTFKNRSNEGRYFFNTPPMTTYEALPINAYDEAPEDAENDIPTPPVNVARNGWARKPNPSHISAPNNEFEDNRNSTRETLHLPITLPKRCNHILNFTFSDNVHINMTNYPEHKSLKSFLSERVNVFLSKCNYFLNNDTTQQQPILDRIYGNDKGASLMYYSACFMFRKQIHSPAIHELGLTKHAVNNVRSILHKLWHTHPPFLVGSIPEGHKGCHIRNLPPEVMWHIMEYVDNNIKMTLPRPSIRK